MTKAPSGVTLGSSASSAKSEAPADDMKQTVRNEVRARWDKFSEQELSGINGKDDLVTQIVARYGTEKMQVQRDVDALLKGRQI